jgi:hypothetical protein
VLGVVFGGIRWFYATQGRATNKGMAVAGVVLGVFAVVFWPLLLVVGVSLRRHDEPGRTPQGKKRVMPPR